MARKARYTSDKSPEELAKELANPNTTLETLKLRTQVHSFKGALPHTNDQESTTLLFQPSIPFPLDNGKSLYFRSAPSFL